MPLGLARALTPRGWRVVALGVVLLALGLGLRYPVVAGVGANLFREEDASELIAAAVEGRSTSESPVVQYFAGLAAQPGVDRAALAAFIRSRRPRLDAGVLAKVTCPVLVVLGDRDFAGPADPLVDALPNATFQPLRGVDHFFHFGGLFELPKVIAEHISRHLHAGAAS